MRFFAGLLQAAFAVALLVQRDFGVQKAAPALQHYQHEGQEQPCFWEGQIKPAKLSDGKGSTQPSVWVRPLTCHGEGTQITSSYYRQALHQSVNPSEALNPPSWHGGISPPWIMQSRQMPSLLLPVITPPQHPSTAPGAALETATPAPKALSVSMAFGNLWAPCPWRSRNTNTTCTNAQCRPNPGRVSDRFPSCPRSTFLDLQHSHHPQPFHLERQFQTCGRRHRKCTEKVGIPPTGMGSAS